MTRSAARPATNGTGRVSPRPAAPAYNPAVTTAAYSTGGTQGTGLREDTSARLRSVQARIERPDGTCRPAVAGSTVRHFCGRRLCS